jgi:hypothetical protein
VWLLRKQKLYLTKEIFYSKNATQQVFGFLTNVTFFFASLPHERTRAVAGLPHAKIVR